MVGKPNSLVQVLFVHFWEDTFEMIFTQCLAHFSSTLLKPVSRFDIYIYKKRERDYTYIFYIICIILVLLMISVAQRFQVLLMKFMKFFSPFQNVTSKQQVVLVGDATVGKTHLLSRYVKSRLPKAWERSFISEGKGVLKKISRIFKRSTFN